MPEKGKHGDMFANLDEQTKESEVNFRAKEIRKINA